MADDSHAGNFTQNSLAHLLAKSRDPAAPTPPSIALEMAETGTFRHGSKRRDAARICAENDYIIASNFHINRSNKRVPVSSEMRNASAATHHVTGLMQRHAEFITSSGGRRVRVQLMLKADTAMPLALKSTRNELKHPMPPYESCIAGNTWVSVPEQISDNTAHTCTPSICSAFAQDLASLLPLAVAGLQRISSSPTASGIDANNMRVVMSDQHHDDKARTTRACAMVNA